ncbi:hypothetical protein LUZ60_008617 [Juncus effusus]|nr:hypothetical protein LUZ60_008617 [Juncus effusus]
MGSCEEGEMINRTAGTLVWVRRRNGSWWPGIVLAKKELPSKLKNSGRFGTPIKLLGRPDGSIDFYNLGKTVRVKSFRCGGEYEEIIEKAKSYVKKNPNEGKYVRREDAILHALEIEKDQKENPISVNKNRNVNSKKQMNGVKKKGLNGNNHQTGSGSKKRSKNPNNDSEEDLKTQGMPRMRDLREIGSKEQKNPKNKSVAITHETKNPNPDLVPNPNPNLVKEMSLQFGGVSATSSSNSTAKRKRSNMAQAYENMRKKHKSVPLSKLSDGSRIIIPSYCNWIGPNTFNTNEIAINNNTNNIKYNNCGQNSSETSSRSNCNGRDLDSINGNSGAFLESGSSDSGFFNVPLVMGDVFEGDYPSAFGFYASDKHDTSVSFEETKNPNFHSNNNNGGLKQEINNHSYENKTSCSESTESDRDSTHAKPDSNSISESGNRIPDENETPAFDSRFLNTQLAPLEEEVKIIKPIKSIPMESYLYDVEIIVKTSHKGPHVPLVSLMSRLNSKAIVGHPVSVQVVKDGSTLHLLKSEKEREHRPSVNTSSINQLLKRDEKVISKRSNNNKKVDRRKVASNSNKKVDRTKMRRLSSITIDRRERRGGERKLLVEKMSGPTVACVPLRLVFSRINEALKFPTN